MGDPNTQLTPKQQAFVDEYVVDFNGKQAAIRAGYAEGSATGQASRMLTYENVHEAIQLAIKERSDRTKIDADWLLVHLSEMAKADTNDILDDDGHFLPIREWPLIWRQMTQGIDIQKARVGYEGEDSDWADVMKAKFVDRLKVAELAGKHVGVRAFKEVVEHEGTITLESILATANGGKSKDKA